MADRRHQLPRTRLATDASYVGGCAACAHIMFPFLMILLTGHRQSSGLRWTGSQGEVNSAFGVAPYPLVSLDWGPVYAALDLSVGNSWPHARYRICGWDLSVAILIAPAGPDKAKLAETAQLATYRADIRRDLKGSDFLHWGEGTFSVSATKIIHQGRLAPGPDYKLYLAAEFVEDEEQFLAVKDTAQLLGDIKTFEGF